MNGLEDNAAYRPGASAQEASPLAVRVHLGQAPLTFSPLLKVTQVGGRDARLFPACTLDFVTLGPVLIPVQWGEIVGESPAQEIPSYWSLIPQFGRVWCEPADARGWNHAALALMLVNDLENHALQGLARFRYRGHELQDFKFQFVQQTAPYLLRQQSVAWGKARAAATALTDETAAAARERALFALSGRLTARPWSDLVEQTPSLDLSQFGRPLSPQWTVMTALVVPQGFYLGSAADSGIDNDGDPATVYYESLETPAGPYPYPLEMRFGVRSILKSIAAPVSLLRLAQRDGPEVLDLKIGRYVAGLHPKYDEVRFIDAANMASGFGGTGTLCIEPNDFEDGYLDADYDGWYTAASHAQKLAHISSHLGPYPWRPGTVLRYRDQDFYLLGAALDGYVKSVSGPAADIWDVLCQEVFAPIGIYAAPTTRTRESGDKPGVPWFNAGYFPTLDDLAKIALLYQQRGEWHGKQILHRALTAELLAATGALSKRTGRPLKDEPTESSWVEINGAASPTHFQMGLHFTPYTSSRSGKTHYLPTMWGAGESEVILYPNGLVSIRIGRAAGVPGTVFPRNVISRATIETVERLGSWEGASPVGTALRSVPRQSRE